MIRGVVLGVLTLSVAANAYLLFADRGGGDRTRAMTGSAAQCLSSVVPAAGVRADAPTPFAQCTRDLAAARAELASTQGALDARIEARARFEQAERAEALERRVRDAIQRALAKGKGVTGDLECRGDTCQVHVSAATRKDARAVWELFTKDPDVKSFADSFTMDAGEPVTDAVTGKGSFDINYFITTASATDLSPRLEQLLQAFASSPQASRCHARSRDAGVLEVKLALVRDERRLALVVGGSLAGTAIGRCLHEQLAAEVAQFAVPDGVTYGEAYASFESPHTI